MAGGIKLTTLILTGSWYNLQ